MVTIRQLSKLLGITSQMIRTYEHYGIVESERDQANYRRFGHESFIRLLKCRRMVSMGFSTKQIIRMTKGVTYLEMQTMLKERADQLEDEIRYLVQKRNSITPTFGFLKDIHKKHGTCELVTAPATYTFPVMQASQVLVDERRCDVLEAWNKYAFAHIEVRRIKPEVIMDGLPMDDIDMQYLINAGTAEAIGLDTSLARFCKEQLCVRAYAIWEGDLSLHVAEHFSFAADFIRNNHLRIVDDPILFLPFWLQEEAGMNYSVMEIRVEREEADPADQGHRAE